MNQPLALAVNVSDYLLSAVSAWETHVLFGVPGPTTSELLAALERANDPAKGRVLEMIVARHESGAAFMADGYARVSGRVGVCLTTAGPGATSAATGVLVAQADGFPVLVLIGECPESDSSRGAFQDTSVLKLDLLEMFRNISGFCGRIDDGEDAAELLANVSKVLAAPRPATAVVGVRSDVATTPAPPGPAPKFMRQAPARNQKEWLGQFEALFGASWPLLFLGSGARRALDDPLEPSVSENRLRQLERVLERHALPIVTSPRAKGIYPEAHVTSLGGYGIAENEWSRRYIHRGIDALTVVGSALGQWTTGGWDRRLAPRGPLVHVDVIADVPGRNYAGTTGVDADAADYLDALIEYGLGTEPHESVEQRSCWLREQSHRKPRWRDDSERDSLETPLKPQRVMSELQAVLNHHARCQKGVNLFCDVGNTLGWAWQHLVLGLPHRFWCNTSMGALGWASGAVIGGKLARPDIPAVALLSENALLMNGVEVSAAAEQRVGAIWLVLAERRPPNSQVVTRSAGAVPCGWQSPCSSNSVNTLEFARSLGATARDIDQPGALARKFGEALEAAASSEMPQVLIIHVDASEKPAFPHLLTRDWSSFGR